MAHRTILFLGAGASVPFDYPTTEQFKIRLKGELSDDLKEQRLLKQVISLDEPKDIEGVLSIFDELCGMESLLQALNFLTKVWPTESKTQEGLLGPWDVVQRAKSIREVIREAVFRYYRPKPERDKDVWNIYSAVLRELFRFTSSMEGVAGSSVIVTTNYDPVIERFSLSPGLAMNEPTKRIRGPVLRDGFRDSADQRGLWDPGWGFSDLSGDRLFLLKLHGSLNWIKQRVTDEIIRLPVSDRFEQFSRQYYDPVLLYPGSKGHPTEEPFTTLFKRFQELLDGAYTCFIVGYSFRDPVINEYLLAFLNNKRKAIYVLSPNAEVNVANNLNPGQPKAGRVHAHNCDFGHLPEYLELLQQAYARSQS